MRPFLVLGCLGALGTALVAQDSKPADKTAFPMDGAAPSASGAGSLANQMGPADRPEPADAPPAAGRLSKADRAFLRAAAQGGIFEVQTGEFAGANGAAYAVRKMGRQVARDHRAINTRLDALARADGLALPGPAPATRERIGALTALSGPAFDRAYARALRAAHRADIAAFEQAEAATRDPGLRALIADSLPVLRRHLAMADDCCKQATSTP